MIINKGKTRVFDEKFFLFGTMYSMEKDDKEQLAALPIFNRLVKTAALKLSVDEASQLLADLNDQLKIIRQLEAIPLEEHIRPVIHGNPYPEAVRCGLREDIPRPFGNSDGIIAQAPSARDRYFVSPDVPHQRIG